MAEAGAPASLREQQVALAQHLRDPASAPAPGGIEDRRLSVYRDLLYNNLQNLLAGNFPVIRRALSDGDWHALVRAFYAGHRCHTPLFTEIGREFVRWLETRPAPDPDRWPWLAELAHYEWVELALQISDAEAGPVDRLAGDPQPDAALLDRIPVLSPQAWALAYRWPVHRIGPGHVPPHAPAQPTLLLVRRDTAGEVRFAEISPLVFRLLERLHPGLETGRACLQALAQEAGMDSDALLDDGRAMLARLHAEGTVLGVRAG